ncbi:Protein CBG18631 [Caenorhabditis briggsae]|uniref:Protein CBG18631 n=1 Tax=Caenorhabditis briggsae TaxID=6238 RepID=A8XTR7_CAEBR|nr:Protein CBG18631 [Caenorhabditis briggsae]CAP36043.2 Protein CBG18631 [Caenorhabditis briggsae]
MKTTRIMIYSIHFITLLLILSLIFTNQLMTNVEEDKPKQEFIINILSVIFNSILISSAFLYIPIYISIFCLRHLASVEKHKPQNYILYHTLLAFLLKTVQLFVIVYGIMVYGFFIVFAIIPVSMKAYDRLTVFR